MKILFLAAEAAPYVKVGGLGDVAGALPAALRRLGHDVRLVMPRIGKIDPKKFGLVKHLDEFKVKMDWRNETCLLMEEPGSGTYFVENQYFFGSRFQVYGCGDEVEQFVLFCRAALEACRIEGWTPDIIHANDWHTAAALRLAWAAPSHPGLVFTIHNMAHQGNQRPDGWPLLGVYDGHGPMNLMEQAIYCADKVTTVSPTYAEEIRRPEFGCGLDWILRSKGENLCGIVNGIDTASYNPASDPVIAANYTADSLMGKDACKRDLLRRFNLPENDAPVLGMVSRLDFQKGVDLLLSSIEDIVNYSDFKIIVLGSGNHDLENQVNAAAARYPRQVACYIGFNASLARSVYAGSDMFLMPSAFEPCGLSQLIAMRYGTLPIARATGGLVDTIMDNRSGWGTGYLFSDYSPEAMLTALGKAQEHFIYCPTLWHESVVRAMKQDLGWDRSAEEYSRLYQSIRH